MRQFYREFPKWNAVRSELSWTHYRMLMKVEKEDSREFYMKEAITGNWSTRQSERQINSLYFDRLHMSKDMKKLMQDVDKSNEVLFSASFKYTYVTFLYSIFIFVVWVLLVSFCIIWQFQNLNDI